MVDGGAGKEGPEDADPVPDPLDGSSVGKINGGGDSVVGHSRQGITNSTSCRDQVGVKLPRYGSSADSGVACGEEYRVHAGYRGPLKPQVVFGNVGPTLPDLLIFRGMSGHRILIQSPLISKFWLESKLNT